MSDYDIVIKLDPGQPVAGAKQVTSAVAQVEVVGEKAKKAVDGVASAAKSLKSIDFKQAAAAGAQAWGILSQKLDIANTFIGEAIDSSVKFAALGAQVAGPWGAALGAIGGAALVLTDNITGLRGEVEKLAEESKKLAEDHLAKMGGELGDLTREVLKNADAAKVQNDAWNELPRTLAYVFQSFTDLRAVLKDVDKDIKAYDASMSKFGWSLTMGLGKSLGGGIRKAEPAERYSYDFLGNYTGQGLDSARKPYMGYGEAADGNPFEYSDLTKIAQEQLVTLNDETLKLAQNTRAWNDELAASNTVLLAVADGIKQAGASFVDTLVDGAFGADVSWKRWGEDMLKMFAKLILQASLLRAIGSPTGGVGGAATGLFKLLGFASGGVIPPRGGGAADTETAMFRVAPRETIRIHTPEQEAAYRNGGGGPTSLNVVVEDTRSRSLLRSPADARRVFLDDAAAGRYRGLLGR
jgi:hypothetical protein